MVISSDIASRIKAARKKAGLTQPQAADQTGVPLSSYQAYEQGKVQPPADRAEHILAVLKGEKEASESPEMNGHSRINEPAPAYERGGGMGRVVAGLVLTLNGVRIESYRIIRDEPVADSAPIIEIKATIASGVDDGSDGEPGGKPLGKPGAGHDEKG